MAELVTLGLLTPEEALVHPARNIVTRCLGRDRWSRSTRGSSPHAGERFLLCTDGLTNEVRDSAIARILLDGDDAQVIADRLVAAAVEAGGRDNVTVVVVLGSASSDGAGRRPRRDRRDDRRPAPAHRLVAPERPRLHVSWPCRRTIPGMRPLPPPLRWNLDDVLDVLASDMRRSRRRGSRRGVPRWSPMRTGTPC